MGTFANAWNLWIELMGDPRMLHVVLGPLLFWMPLLGLLLLLVAWIRQKPARTAAFFLGGTLALVIAYHATLTLAINASAPPAIDALDPSRALYRIKLHEHLAEVSLLHLPALILLGLAVLALIRPKPTWWQVFLTVPVVLWLSGLALILNERKARYDHPELPLGSPRLEELFRATHEPDDPDSETATEFETVIESETSLDVEPTDG